MLDDASKGKRITGRREDLAGVSGGSDTSAFRRDRENPLYKELAQFLIERSNSLDTGVKHHAQAGHVGKLDSLCHAFARCRWYIKLHLGERRQKFWPPFPGQAALQEYSRLHAELYDHPSREDGLDYPLVDLFSSERAHATFFQLLTFKNEGLTPFTQQELAVLRNIYRSVGREPTMLHGYFTETPEGRALAKTWRNWLTTCGCEGQPRDGVACRVHSFLTLSQVFLKLAGREDLGGIDDPLEDESLHLSRLLDLSTEMRRS
jgi:hypothetical protein